MPKAIQLKLPFCTFPPYLFFYIYYIKNFEKSQAPIRGLNQKKEGVIPIQHQFHNAELKRKLL